jgi:hypothetical protein
MGIRAVNGAAVEQAKQHAKRAAREAAPWVEPLARFGYAAKGVVYVIVGILALPAATGIDGQATDTQGALRVIVRQPFGQFLLALVAVGLLGYALWRLVQAVLDPERKGTDAKGIVKRLGYAISGLAYGGLAVTAAGMLIGLAGGSGNSTQKWTALLLSQPFGPWLVGAVGLIIIAVGINALYVAYTAKFCEKLKLGEMSEAQRSWATWVGRIGLTARGLILGLIGLFLLVAAWQTDANEARGLAGAFKVLARQPYGPWLLGTIAVGFIAYGVYMFFEARFRRISAV